MSDKELNIIEGEPDPKPFKLWRTNNANEQIELVGEFATLEEIRAQRRRADWRYAEYQGRKKLSR